MSDFGEMTTTVPRKPHRCEWCGEPIAVGEECKRYHGMWQGDWQNWYMHFECAEVYGEEGDDFDDGFTPYDHERPSKLVEAK